MNLPHLERSVTVRTCPVAFRDKGILVADENDNNSMRGSARRSPGSLRGTLPLLSLDLTYQQFSAPTPAHQQFMALAQTHQQLLVF